MASNIMDLLYEFDDLSQAVQVLLSNACEIKFKEYVEYTNDLHLKLTESRNECKRLNAVVVAKDNDIAVLNTKLTTARKWVDTERKQRKTVEKERDILKSVFEDIRRVLLNDPRYKLPDDAREKLSSISRTLGEPSNGHHEVYDRLNAITELSSSHSESSVSVSISMSGDDLDESLYRLTRKHRPSYPEKELCIDYSKKRKSDNFPPFAPSAPLAELPELFDSEFIPEVKNKESECEKNVHTPNFDHFNSQNHTFVKINLCRGDCLSCEKNIRMFITALKCTRCNAIVHRECRDKAPMPCIPMGTPSKSGGTITDYAPLFPPKIPAIVIHCINEVERRKVKETGIYRIPANDKDVRILKEKFLRGRGAPQLSKEDIHTVCSCLKDFLRTLRDPLIPQSKWDEFAKAIYDADKFNKLSQSVSDLPQANRDTLAFLILHLQRVASIPTYKMPITNLATIFGPTIVGRSNSEGVDPYQETQIANTIMEELLMLAPSFWAKFIDCTMVAKTPNTLRSTPSTEGLMKKTSRKLLTPGNRKKFFDNPVLNGNGDS